LPEYYYGRFDLKVPSLQDLCQGKNLKIMEVNGVNSEPAHIYEPETKLSTAMKTLLNHWKIIYEISKMNRKRGLSPQKFSDAWADFMERKKIN
jgi:hypothetical protein